MNTIVALLAILAWCEIMQTIIMYRRDEKFDRDRDLNHERFKIHQALHNDDARAISGVTAGLADMHHRVSALEPPK